MGFSLIDSFNASSILRADHIPEDIQYRFRPNVITKEPVGHFQPHVVYGGKQESMTFSCGFVRFDFLNTKTTPAPLPPQAALEWIENKIERASLIYLSIDYPSYMDGRRFAIQNVKNAIAIPIGNKTEDGTLEVHYHKLECELTLLYDARLRAL